jgi:hypothetical protein
MWTVPARPRRTASRSSGYQACPIMLSSRPISGHWRQAVADGDDEGEGDAVCAGEGEGEGEGECEGDDEGEWEGEGDDEGEWEGEGDEGDEGRDDGGDDGRAGYDLWAAGRLTAEDGLALADAGLVARAGAAARWLEELPTAG